MAEEQSPRRGGNRVYRLIDRGPLFLGLPILQGAAIAGSAAMGYWVVKMVANQTAALLWVALGGVFWAFAGFLNSQDKTFLPRLYLRLSGVVMKDRITSYIPSDQNIEVE